MPHQEFRQPLELWVNEALVLPECRPSFLLMHETLRESHPELEYWNLLREILPKIVKVNRFKNLNEAGSLVITPNDYRDYLGKPQKNTLDKFKKEVLTSGRTLITFTPSLEYKPEPGEIAFATSVYQIPGERLIPIPTWLYDLRTKISEISKPEIPTVNFVGNTKYPGRISSLAGLPMPHRIKSWLASSRFVNQNISLGARRGIGRIVRSKVIQVAESAPNLHTDIIARTSDFFLMTSEEKQKARAEYIQHIQDNAYTICMRGDNNDNYQMYEVMSAGRIPILIDTNLRRPALKNGRWEDFCVIVPFKEIHRLGEIIEGFHNKLSPEDFLAVCRKSRAAFEELLPHNFVFQILQEIVYYSARNSMAIGVSQKSHLPLNLG
jgi:hypothetical protein